MATTKNFLLNWYSSIKSKKIRKWLWESDLGTFWRPLWTSVKVKSKKYFYFTDFFAKIKPLLTHVRKTPPLRSHYSFCKCTKILSLEIIIIDLKIMVKSVLAIKKFQIQRAPSEIPTNLPGQFSLYG